MKELTAAMDLKITLLELNSSPWRRLRVPLTTRYDQLDVLIQLAFGIKTAELYSFEPYERSKSYENTVDKPDDSFGIHRIRADFGYPYSDLIDNGIMLEIGYNYQFDIAFQKTISFTHLKNNLLPYCIDGNDDGSNLKDIAMFKQNEINQKFATWARSGEKMISGLDQWPFLD